MRNEVASEKPDKFPKQAYILTCAGSMQCSSNCSPKYRYSTLWWWCKISGHQCPVYLPLHRVYNKWIKYGRLTFKLMMARIGRTLNQHVFSCFCPEDSINSICWKWPFLNVCDYGTHIPFQEQFEGIDIGVDIQKLCMLLGVCIIRALSLKYSQPALPCKSTCAVTWNASDTGLVQLLCILHCTIRIRSEWSMDGWCSWEK